MTRAAAAKTDLLLRISGEYLALLAAIERLAAAQQTAPALRAAGPRTI